VTVEETDVIDFISLHPDGSRVVLTISDHLDWEDGEKHAAALQTKIYRYLDFVDHGELLERYPKAVDKQVVIEIRGSEPLTAYGERFLEHVRKVAAAEGCLVEFIYLGA